MAETKPFGISKRAVWEAYRRVRKNGGAAGVDRQSLEEFEQDLSNNLYKLWNRLASGSYFAPPVLMVEIPKARGGMRTLGICRRLPKPAHIWRTPALSRFSGAEHRS